MTKAPITKFLLRCSGANLDYLAKCPKSEHIKHAGIGATILLTAALAFASGGYALFTIFNTIPLAIAFGVLWALIIFNLDRLIVSSMRKTGSWWKQLLAATPRLFLAVLIAIVISKPIEIKLLESKLEKVLFESEQESVGKLGEACQNVREEYDSKIDAKRAAIDEKEDNKPSTLIEFDQLIAAQAAKIDDKEKYVNSHTRKYYVRIKEIDRELATLNDSDSRSDGRISERIRRLNQERKGAKDRIRYYERQLTPLKNELKGLEAEKKKQFQDYLDELEAFKATTESEIEQLRKEKKEEVEKCRAAKSKGENIYANNSLPDLILALNKATDEDQAMSLLSWFIMLLFIMLETAPVFVKLLAPRGPYDELLYKEEEQYKIDARKEVIRAEQELQRDVQMFADIDQTEMEEEVRNNKRVLKAVSDAHHTLIEEQIKIWLEEEKQKLSGNGRAN